MSRLGVPLSCSQASRLIIRHAPRTDHPISHARMTQTATVVDSGNSRGFPLPPPGHPRRRPARGSPRRKVGCGQADHRTLQVGKVWDPRPGEDRCQDDLENDHDDHRHRPLPDQRTEPQPDDKPDDHFEFKPQPALDHERVRRVQEIGVVVGIVHAGDLAGRLPDLRLRSLRRGLALGPGRLFDAHRSVAALDGVDCRRDRR